MRPIQATTTDLKSHDIWAAIKSGLSGSFRLTGRMGRSKFWLWIGTLHVVSILASLVESHRGPEPTGAWSGLQAIIENNWAVKYVLQNMGMSWPTEVAVTPFPLGYIGSMSTTLLDAMPLLVLINLLAIAPVVQRSRDAGYSPLLTLILLFWSVVATAAILAIAMPLGALSSASAWAVGMPVTIYFSYIGPFLSVATALAAIYRLSAPSLPGPNPLEVTP